MNTPLRQNISDVDSSEVSDTLQRVLTAAYSNHTRVLSLEQEISCLQSELQHVQAYSILSPSIQLLWVIFTWFLLLGCVSTHYYTRCIPDFPWKSLDSIYEAKFACNPDACIYAGYGTTAILASGLTLFIWVYTRIAHSHGSSSRS